MFSLCDAKINKNQQKENELEDFFYKMVLDHLKDKVYI